MRIPIFLAAIAVLASPALGEPGHAPRSPESLTRHVEYRDIDLAYPPNAKALRRRVRDAVHELCREASGPDNGSADFRFAMMKCEKHSWREARSQFERATHSTRQAGRVPDVLGISIRAVAAPAR